MDANRKAVAAHVTNILLTTDFSENARRAYSVAASIARRFHARIHLAHALVSGEGEWAPGVDADVATQRVDAELRRELSSQVAFDGVETTPATVRHRWPHKGLEDYSQHAGIDLVVTATHGWAGLTQFLLGSFAERLVRNARRPVLTVRFRGEGSDSFSPRAVLVPYDFSRTAPAVLPVVRMLAEHFHCAFTFLYVHGHSRGSAPFLARLRRTREDDTSHVEQQFKDIRERELPGVDARLMTAHGVVYEEVLRVADEIGADLALLATHGLLGALSQNVLRALHCSVLTVYAAMGEGTHPE